MSWEEWLKDLNTEGMAGREMPVNPVYSDAKETLLHAFAHDCIVYWFGKVRGDRIPILEGAEDLIVEIIKKAEASQFPGCRLHWEVYKALLCGLLKSNPIDAMQNMIQAVHIGMALGKLPQTEVGI